MQTALVSGHLGEIAGLAAAIESSLASLAGLKDAEALLRIKSKAARNEVCLAASARGVRAARRRLADVLGDVLGARQGLQTYDGQGRRALVATGDGRMTRRF